MSQINKELSALENIVALVKEVNPSLTLTSSQVTLGTPSSAVGENYNTEITLSAVANAGYKGSKVFKYTRLSLNQGVASVPASVLVTADDTEDTAAAKVAGAYGLIEGEFTVSDYVAPQNEDTNGSVVITPKPESVFYAGEAVTVTLTIADADQDMDSAFTNDTLNGFEQPSAQG